MQRNFFVGGSEELHVLRSLSIPDGFEGGSLNRHGLQTVTTGCLELQVNTIVQQQQLIAQPPTPATAGRGPAARSYNANNTLRAISSARTLGASETAAVSRDGRKASMGRE